MAGRPAAPGSADLAASGLNVAHWLLVSDQPTMADLARDFETGFAHVTDVDRMAAYLRTAQAQTVRAREVGDQAAIQHAEHVEQLILDRMAELEAF
jgi:hypothetical protein